MRKPQRPVQNLHPAFVQIDDVSCGQLLIVFGLCSEVGCNFLDLLVAVSLGNLVHQRGWFAACLEVEHFLCDVGLVFACQGFVAWLCLPIGAMTVGTGRSPHFDLGNLLLAAAASARSPLISIRFIVFMVETRLPVMGKCGGDE